MTDHVHFSVHLFLRFFNFAVPQTAQSEPSALHRLARAGNLPGWGEVLGEVRVSGGSSILQYITKPVTEIPNKMGSPAYQLVPGCSKTGFLSK